MINYNNLRDFNMKDMAYGSSSYGSASFGAFANILPAHILATNITTDKNTCIESCDLAINVTWLNDGGSAGTFTPKILVNRNAYTLPDESLNAGSSITKVFSLTGLTAGNYNICPEPNTLPCITVTVFTPANIITTDISLDKTTCTAPCNVTVNVTWTNNGGVSKTFTPEISVDGISNASSSVALAPGDNTIIPFGLTGLAAGIHTICAIPLGTTTCKTLTVSQAPVQRAGLGPLLGLGILAGFLIFSGRYKKKKDTIDNVQSLINRSNESLDMIINDAVPNCNPLLFAHLNGEIGKTNGAALLAHNIYPDDKRLSDLLCQSQRNVSKAFEAGNLFESECNCTQESKIT